MVGSIEERSKDVTIGDSLTVVVLFRKKCHCCHRMVFKRRGSDITCPIHERGMVVTHAKQFIFILSATLHERVVTRSCLSLSNFSQTVVLSDRSFSLFISLLFSGKRHASWLVGDCHCHLQHPPFCPDTININFIRTLQ